jgi:hydrogenase-4 component B
MRGGSVSTAGIAAMLVLLTLLLALLLFAGRRNRRRASGPTWDCGLPGLTAANEYTATGFSKAFRMIFKALYRPKREIQADFDVSAYYPTAIRFESEIEPTFEKHVYDPLKEWLFRTASRMRSVQAGSIHAYLAYIFVALLALLLFGVRG